MVTTNDAGLAETLGASQSRMQEARERSKRTVVYEMCCSVSTTG